ncbi:hypothetical protein RRF57_006853 [Xylaria bambusicola]|uniref:Uncharacterized protein n=1 Tax=Xylaria bambusicola TaxID=326684 RepID=A0AAN7UTV4_9PEZI
MRLPSPASGLFDFSDIVWNSLPSRASALSSFLLCKWGWFEQNRADEVDGDGSAVQLLEHV